MATREVTLALPEELVHRMQVGQLNEVANELVDQVRHEVRRAAILDYLATCESAGHPRVTDGELREFLKLVGEEQG